MPLQNFYPKQGHVLRCDFSRGFIEPEMVKPRPVVVISPAATHNRRVCTVVPLSTTRPHRIENWHIELSVNPLPDSDPNVSVWAKCDMLYTVSFERLDKLHRKTARGREYFAPRIEHAVVESILQAVRTYLCPQG